MNQHLPVALTMGDPAGIGGEITLMAWRDHRPYLPAFYVIDDPSRLRQLAIRSNLECSIEQIYDPSEALNVCETSLPVLMLSKPVQSLPGDDSTPDGAMVIESIDRALDAATNGAVAGMVTNPIQKSLLYTTGFASPGHTEYLGERAGLRHPPIMLLVGPHLKVVPVTIHLALRDAIAALTHKEIVRTLKATAESLKLDFGIQKPRIAVSGLNPHAGEGGYMGREEIEIIAPAISDVVADGYDIRGPLAGDTMFHEEARKSYDAAVCMYHDQALIPMKTLDFDNGVNFSAGLPFVRTSPDHGTAYDIAGKGAASPRSLVSAIQMASQIAACRNACRGGVKIA
ncbi:MAG: 4-hydroxythreonine-4-phosphate dehydrogenase PdxA [Pseudomonadota bacterium]|nr:4-hydroxythreonine-4-phosphate dehydrogenase PdxA [Pseudomonadota bacterium]